MKPQKPKTMAKKPTKKKAQKKALKKVPRRNRVLIVPLSDKVTWQERKLVIPIIVKRIRLAQRQKQAITNSHLCNSLAKHDGIKINTTTVRKLIHYIRVNGIIKRLLAGSHGYFVSSDPVKIANYLKRLNKVIREIGTFKQAICDQSTKLLAKHGKNPCKPIKTTLKTRKK